MTKRAKLPTVVELDQHVHQLAAAFKVRLVLSDELCKRPHDAQAGRRVRLIAGRLETEHQVIAQPVTDEARYAVVMHELGHCCSAMGFMAESKTDFRYKLLQERAAWEWARHYALDWTAAMEMVEKLAMSSYELGAQFERAETEADKALEQKKNEIMRKWLKGLKL